MCELPFSLCNRALESRERDVEDLIAFGLLHSTWRSSSSRYSDFDFATTHGNGAVLTVCSRAIWLCAG